MQRKSWIIIVILGFLLSACADRAYYSDAKRWIGEQHPEDARIFVYRSRQIGGYLFPYTFVLNGEEVSDFYAGTSFYVDVKPGTHKVTFRRGTRTMDVSVAAGERVYLRYDLVADSSNPDVMIVQNVKADQAEEELNSTQLIDPQIPIVRHPRFYF